MTAVSERGPGGGATPFPATPAATWAAVRPLIGTRVRLEPLRPEHAPDLLEAAQDDEIWAYMPALRPRRREDMDRLIADALADGTAGTRIAFAIVARDSGRAVGSTSYLDLEPVHRRLEIGWTWLARDRWRTAANTEAKRLLLAHAFEVVGAVRVALKTDGRNLRSQQAIARLGARREGVLRRHQRCPDGVWRDTVYFSILEDEWPGVDAGLRRALAQRPPRPPAPVGAALTRSPAGASIGAGPREGAEEAGGAMADVVRAALVQTRWTGERASMVEANVRLARRAAEQGARVLCFQELFSGPYFCQVQDPSYYALTEPVPEGPTVEAMRRLAAELGMVLIVPVYEQEQPGVYYNTAAVIDADGRYCGKYRKHHIPQVRGFWEKFYFRPGNLGYPVFETAVGPIGVYLCYDRHFPEGWRALGLAGARIVFNPSATSRGLSSHLWRLEQPAAAVANEYFVGAINRVGVEPLGDNDFYGGSYFVDPRGQLVGAPASDQDDEVVVRDLDMELLREVRQVWAFYRDRRPDAYDALVAP